MKELLAVAVGGALGAVSRFVLSAWAQQFFAVFPGGTLLVNGAGAFAFGLLASVMGKSPSSQLFWFFGAVGFLGAFTTFSAFSWELLELIRSRLPRLALSYGVLSFLVALVSVSAGVFVGELLGSGVVRRML